MLLNWAIRRGRRPLYVDLDVGQGALAVPGALGAVLTDKPLDVVEGVCTLQINSLLSSFLFLRWISFHMYTDTQSIIYFIIDRYQMPHH